MILHRGPKQSPHSHPANVDAAKAEVERVSLKRKAVEEPHLPPAKMIRHEISDLPIAVLSQLPERENLSKAIRRSRRRNLPANPRSLVELGELPEIYTRTISKDQFLVYDLETDEEYSDDGRVLVFATRHNLQALSKSNTWFVDGTFKVCPNIFTQLFAILGTVTQPHKREDSKVLGLPFVYALLSSKRTGQYEAVMRAVQSAARNYGIQHCVPTRILSDFETAIITACHNIFPECPVAGCFFHLGQNVYKHIQAD